MFVDTHALHAGLFGNTSQKESSQKRKALMTKEKGFHAILLWFTSALVLRCLRRTGSIRWARNYTKGVMKVTSPANKNTSSLKPSPFPAVFIRINCNTS